MGQQKESTLFFSRLIGEQVVRWKISNIMRELKFHFRQLEISF